MKKEIVVATFIYNNETLEFQVSDLTCNRMNYIVGDIEALQSCLFETYRVDKVKIHTADFAIAERLIEVGFEDVNVLDTSVLKPSE